VRETILKTGLGQVWSGSFNRLTVRLLAFAKIATLSKEDPVY
jgi:hypothetical protein